MSDEKEWGKKVHVDRTRKVDRMKRNKTRKG
jgi:hypothetical protein